MRAIAVKQPVVVAALLNCRKARVDIHKQRPVKFPRPIPHLFSGP
jgi:hypothetical protein